MTPQYLWWDPRSNAQIPRLFGVSTEGTGEGGAMKKTATWNLSGTVGTHSI